MRPFAAPTWSVRFLLLGALGALAAPALAADPRATQRRAFEAAYDAAEQGPPGRWQALARDLADYPLYPYLEWAALRRDLHAAQRDAVRAFLARHAGSPLADDLRARWLHHLAARGRWADFLADYDATAADTALRCRHATGRIALGRTADVAPDAEALWRTGGSLPRACDAVIAWLAKSGRLTSALVWERIELAAANGQAGLLRHLAARLPAADRPVALRFAATLADPARGLAAATGWPDDARHRALVVLAVAQLARRQHEQAAKLWPALDARFTLTPEQRGRALAALALWHAASYASGAERWLAQVPASATDDSLREWRVREALARSHYPDALAALAALSPAQQAEGRWRYVRARVLEELGRGGEAAPLLDALTTEATYHGFLAAERRGLPYSICPADGPPVPDAVVQAALRRPGLQRAFELVALGWRTHARREWDYALRGATPAERRAAVEAAHARGWIDRGPLTLLAPEDLRLYALRFPLAYEQEIRHHAKKNGIDAAWALAIVRAESAWVADARSSADARGLMQLLPGTAQRVAKKLRVPYRGAADLDRPTLNIALGTRHLADELASHLGRVWLATAAYNAGPTPVARWMAQRGGLPADLWVETIPYRETREYVARVLAFSVIYDWRLNGDAAPLGSRLAPVAVKPAPRKPVQCLVEAEVARDNGT
jgi:soluble lytic murein transglycosylase